MEYLSLLRHVFLSSNRYLYVVHGFCFSLSIALLSAILGVFLGLLCALLRYSKIRIISSIIISYIDIIRGTPVLVQLMIFANLIFVGVLRDVPIFLIAVLTFAINSSAYVSEIFRSGIEGIDRGQMDVAKALGMSDSMAMREIILPQAIRKILPALVNEFISLFKETSVVGFVGGVDLMRSANIITSQTYRGTEPLLLVGLIYLLCTSLFTKFMRKIEKNLGQYDSN